MHYSYDANAWVLNYIKSLELAGFVPNCKYSVDDNITCFHYSFTIHRKFFWAEVRVIGAFTTTFSLV